MNPAVPTWAGVAASLALVATAITVAWRQRLHLAREITLAAARAGAQLTATHDSYYPIPDGPGGRPALLTYHPAP